MSADDDAQQVLLKLIEDGVSSSADMLAKVSHTAWMTQSVSINTDTIENVSAHLERDDSEQYGAFASMSGILFLLMFPKQRGSKLSGAFMSGYKERPGAPLNDEVCINEIANIVINSIAKTLADACDMAFILTAPEVIADKKTGLLKRALEKQKTGGEKHAIMAYVHMSSEILSSDCTVLMFLSPLCRSTMLKALDR